MFFRNAVFFASRFNQPVYAPAFVNRAWLFIALLASNNTLSSSMVKSFRSFITSFPLMMECFTSAPEALSIRVLTILPVGVRWGWSKSMAIKSAKFPRRTLPRLLFISACAPPSKAMARRVLAGIISGFPVVIPQATFMMHRNARISRNKSRPPWPAPSEPKATGIPAARRRGVWGTPLPQLLNGQCTTLIPRSCTI